MSDLVGTTIRGFEVLSVDPTGKRVVDLVNEYYIPLLVSDLRRRREANYCTVLKLIQRNRAKWPQGPSWG
jgi:hypothetical protein